MSNDEITDSKKYDLSDGKQGSPYIFIMEEIVKHRISKISST
jgi:hypothetical protein